MLIFCRCSMIVHVEYRCPECDKVFNCPANLASHRRWHKPRQGQSMDGLSPNEKRSFPSNITKCSSRENDAYEELNNNDSGSLDKEEDFTTGDGDFEEDSTHRKKSSTTHLHTCNICKKKFRKLQSLEKHLTLHATSIGKSTQLKTINQNPFREYLRKKH